MVGAPLKPLALLTLASWMRKAHRLCKAGDKSERSVCLIATGKRREISHRAHCLVGKLSGMVWRKSRDGARISFCKSRWVNLMILFFFPPLFLPSRAGTHLCSGWSLTSMRDVLIQGDCWAMQHVWTFVGSPVIFFPFYPILHRPRPRLNKLPSHNVRQRTHTHTHAHTTAVCRCYLGCGLLCSVGLDPCINF